MSHNKIGDVLLDQGNLAEALEAYRRSMEVAGRLAQSDPSNAGWQRDLYVSFWRLADVAEKSGDGEAPQLWRRAYETLASMRDRGLFLSPDDCRFLEILADKVGGVS